MKKLDPKTDGATPDSAEQNIEKLKALFPDVFTEGKIDFDTLRETLGDYTDDRPERYSFTWNGKSRARRIAQTPSAGTLRPFPEESVNWDTTQNLFIEGDNLEVLKLLQKSYHKKIKMIYIDPPYNTGRDFIYPDDFKDNIRNYMEQTGQVDDEGRKMSVNAEMSGRYHTNWLNMMYPRLKLARNLLRDDGAIFISIDENELHNLCMLCNEVLGEENFVECLVYDKKAAPKGVPPTNMIVGVHEYILCYSRSDVFSFNGVPRSMSGFANPDNDPRGPWRNTNIKSTVKDGSESFEITDPETGNAFSDTWAHSKGELDRMIAEKRLLFPKDANGQVRKKEFFSEFKNENIPIKSSLGLYDAQKTTEQLTRLMNGKFFLNPKSQDLMHDLVSYVTAKDDTVLDYFSGACTTAHAILDLNREDSGNRKFIMVQLPEPCDDKSEALKAGFMTIADIGKERIRRVIKKLESEQEERAEEAEGKLPRASDNPVELDLGFKVFKLDASNIKPWDADFDNLEKALWDAVENIKPDRSEADVLYELLIKYGLDLAVPIEERQIFGKTIFIIGAGALIVCLAKKITLEVVEGIADLKEELKPELMRVVFKDSGFADDVVKTNAVQILHQAGIEDVKSL
jgi:adenine-specific DNA-methyltransferase